MLDVERGVDVDPGGEQLLHVLLALGMAGAGDVGVGELVDQDERGPAREDGVDVHFVEDGLIFDAPARDVLQPPSETRSPRGHAFRRRR